MSGDPLTVYTHICYPLKATPFIRLIIPLAGGICFQVHYPLPWMVWAILLLMALVVLSAWLLLPLGRQYVWSHWQGLLLYLLLFCAGALLLPVKDIRRDPAYFGNRLQNDDTLLVQLLEPLQEKARSQKTTVRVAGILRKGEVIGVKGKMLLYFQKEQPRTFKQQLPNFQRPSYNRLQRLSDSLGRSFSQQPSLDPPPPQCGDLVWINTEPRPVSNTGNPGAFDYRQYCAARQIFHQAYIKTGHWKKSPRPDKAIIDQWLIRARAWCLQTLERYIGKGPDAALAAALLIGYRYDLDHDMVQSYTNAGVVHIIAISGMHLALIYASLLWLLKWWPPHRFADLIKAAIIIVVLWGFALITGAAASILRAAVMFTALAIGQFVLNRYTNIYNTLAASAFLLLCYDPWLLLDAGFQLSYLAVGSILLCYQPLYGLWEIRNKWLNRLWEAIALTLAAQLFTLPVCLYYFHQFPNLFLPANLLIVALSTIILYGLILLLLLAPIPIAAHYCGLVTQWLITAMNKIVLFIERLPYAVTDNIGMPLYATVYAYMLLCGLTAVWLAKWKYGWWMAAGAGLLWAATDLVTYTQALQQKQLLVYNVPGYTGVDIIQGRRISFAGDIVLEQNYALRQRYLQPTRLYYRAKEPQLIRDHFISIGGKRLVIIDGTWRACRPVKKLRVDYILLSHRPRLTISQLKDMFTCKMIIFDASCPFWQIQRWKNDCSALTLRCFSVPEQGAYLINF